MVGRDRVFAYPFKGYWRDVGTIDAYWQANMDLLADIPEFNLYDPEHPIVTRHQERPPSKHGPHAVVSRSLVSSGAIVNGTVRNSVISPGVFIAAGAQVIDSILFDDSVINQDCIVHRCVVDKRVEVSRWSHLGFGDDLEPNQDEPENLQSGITIVGKGAQIPERVRVGRNCKVMPFVQPEDFDAGVRAERRDDQAQAGEARRLMSLGAFTFVLHSHLPYARRAGRWPHGEEWIHEALTETYLPLAIALHDLRDQGVPFRLTLGLTPVLLEQLADDLIKDNFDTFIDEKVQRARGDSERFADEPGRLAVARYWLSSFERLAAAFRGRFGRDIVGAFRSLSESGHVEVLTSAATHGYLPLLATDSSIRGQLRTGVRASSRHIGKPPRSTWLPECAYRPGIEGFLDQEGLGLFFVETHLVEGGRPTGKAIGDAVGAYGEVRRRYDVPAPRYPSRGPATTFQPYLVADSDVAVLARNSRTGLQVWSAEHGYPGDYWYREFHKKDGESGLHYWRVSGAGVDLADKEIYDPGHAASRAKEHAEHFASLVVDLLKDYQTSTSEPGIVVAAYDTELFGHWWFEGIDWLAEVLRLLAAGGEVELTTAGDYVTTHPPQDRLALPEGSWGQAGTHFTWRNADTEWMWPLTHEAERRMERLVADGSGNVEVLNQAARELVLLESSDWPFLVTTGQAADYAVSRFLSHVERFNELADALETGRDASDRAAELFELDKVFPDIDHRDFSPVGRPAAASASRA